MILIAVPFSGRPTTSSRRKKARQSKEKARWLETPIGADSLRWCGSQLHDFHFIGHVGLETLGSEFCETENPLRSLLTTVLAPARIEKSRSQETAQSWRPASGEGCYCCSTNCRQGRTPEECINCATADDDVHWLLHLSFLSFGRLAWSGSEN